MADLTPNDIINKEFRLALRGYAPQEVDDFLQEASDSLFKAMEENRRLYAQLDEARARLQQYQQTEDLIKNALLLAERTGEEIRKAAHQEADLIRREVEDQIRAERAEMEELRQARYRIIAELRSMLQSHLAMLEAQERRASGAAEGAQG